MRRQEDWLRQADRDLAHARRALEAGDYEWACFAAQQAAEKAVKGLLQHLGIDAWGHSVAFLLAALPEASRPDASVLDGAKELDRHYIPSRYPDAHPAGAPADFYTRADARRAIGHAERIMAHVRSHLQAP